MPEPFSRLVRVDAIPKEGQTVALEASAPEREALAAFYNLPSIEALTASLFVRPASHGGVRVTGAVHGALTQICVVSLDPFPATIDEAIDVRFVPRPEETVDGRALQEPQSSSMADEDEPDPITDGKIDLGALAAEFFALGLDPYPRKPGAIFESPEDRDDNISPFSTLAEQAQKRRD
jgi:hypothetical protein